MTDDDIEQIKAKLQEIKEIDGVIDLWPHVDCSLYVGPAQRQGARLILISMPKEFGVGRLLEQRARVADELAKLGIGVEPRDPPWRKDRPGPSRRAAAANHQATSANKKELL